MNPMKLCALGPKGTNGHQAAVIAQKLLTTNSHSAWSTTPLEIDFCDRNASVLEAVVNRGGFGVVPVENSTAGYVADVIKGFWLTHPHAKDVVVIGEIDLPVEHCLLVHQHVSHLHVITHVASHPQAIEQCFGSLARWVPSATRLPVASTALAAKMVSESDPPYAIAAIASSFAAKEWGLKVPLEHIEDASDNTTRFHIVANTTGRFSGMPVTGNDRTAIIFETPDVSGALVAALNTISVGGVNLSSIHSIPLGTPGRFAFYCEFNRHRLDPEGSAILTRLHTLTHRLIILGSFPQGIKANGGVK